MVSVVLPTYNGIKYIEKSIKSVVRQTYTDLELIIVDDCSTDGTNSLVDTYAKKDSRIHVIHNKDNKKLPASLNIGFNEAHGNYFTWTSDDNYYSLTAIEEMVNFLEENPQVDVVYADYKSIDEDDNILQEIIHAKETNLYSGNCVGACFLYKRKVHETLHGYNEELFLIEDYDFWLRAGLQFQYGVLNKFLYFYRFHEASLTGSRKKDITVRTDKLIYDIYNSQKLIQDERIEILKRLSIDAYYNVYNKRDLKKYMNLLKEESKMQYKLMGKELRLGQYLPKSIIRRLKAMRGSN